MSVLSNFPSNNVDKHASQHAANGSDPISLADIGVSNPWINDNGVFLSSRLIDQRQGYVVLPGLPYRKVSDYSLVGNTDKYYPVAYIDNTLNPHFYVDGVEHYVDHNHVSTAYVRGYTERGYTVDRWIKLGGTIILADEGLSFSGSSDTDDYIFDIRQVIDSSLLKSIIGKQVTLSALIRIDAFTGNNLWLQLANDTKKHYSFQKCLFSTTQGLVMLKYTGVVPNDWESTDYVRLTIGMNGTNINGMIKAAKFELGDHQTLAHQDSSGKWVLNELPNYADTLARCQRWFVRFKQINAFADTNNNLTKIAIIVSTPVPMATTPVISNATGSFHSNGSQGLLRNFAVSRASQNWVLITADLSTVLGNSLSAHQPGTVYDIYCDLTCEL